METPNTVIAVTPDDQKAFDEASAKALRIIKLKAILDSVKPVYEELDRLTLELKTIIGTDRLIELNLTEEQAMFVMNGEVRFIARSQVVSIVDNFAEKNVVFRPAGVKRFEVNTETKEEYVTRIEKAAKKKAKAQ
jgi:hypothetical protein